MQNNEFIERVLNNQKDAEVLLQAYVSDEDMFPAYRLAMVKSCREGVICFNMLGFLFGMLYFVYHRLYLPGFIIFLMGIILPYLLPANIIFWVTIAMAVFTGVTFFKFYFNRFFRIVRQSGYGSLPLEEVTDRVRKAGGKDKSAYVIFGAMCFITLLKAYFEIQLN